MKMIVLQFIEETDAGAEKFERTLIEKAPSGAQFDPNKLGIALLEFTSTLRNGGHMKGMEDDTPPQDNGIVEVPPAPPAIDGPGSTSLQ